MLTADGHDGLSCTVLLTLGLRLFPGELAFNHTSRLDNHNRQCHSLWGLSDLVHIFFWDGVQIHILKIKMLYFGGPMPWTERSQRVPQLHRGPTRVTPSTTSTTPSSS